MDTRLIIVESPTKAKTLARFLGGKYQVAATLGHLRDLPKESLGIDLENNFTPQYQLVDKKKETFKQIEKLAAAATQIYLATDPDREGEAIAWHAAALLRGDQPLAEKIFKRITFHEITKTAVEKALNQPGEINLPLVNAQQARRVLDRLVGYKLSPLLWQKIRKNLSAGRVQSVAVRLIVEKEREVAAFKSEEYWHLWVELTNGHSFLAKLNQKVTSGQEAKALMARLKQCRYSVAALDQKEVSQKPAEPFRTATLQQKAAQAYGFTGQKTMRAAQSLYEKGLITYHRTDSAFLADEAITQIRAQIKKKWGEKYLAPSPRRYLSRAKVAQEAHEAIRPTRITQEEPAGLDKNEQRLYFLIFRRTLACQMSDALWQNTRAEILGLDKGKRYELLAEGKHRLFDGWLRLYPRREEEKPLPVLKVDEELRRLSLRSEQKFTQPPARYSEAALIKTLEQKGIGRPSTYAPILVTIQYRQYVEKIEGKFHPTALGITVNDFLLTHFSDLFDYDFTARMEDDLDAIANGRKEWVPLVRDFYQPFSAKLTSVVKTAKRVIVPVEKTGQKCGQCDQGEIVIRVGRFGKFLSCSRYPECKYTAPYIEKVLDQKCPQCGGEVVVRRTKRGKRFYGCGNYPKCTWASWRKPK
ncbi:MAG: type I DNA topoisomerase [Candidatus Shapirobacteria bacterium]